MHLYDIPVIQPDLRHEETIIQTANVLEHLSNIVNHVFDTIEARIARNVAKTAELNQRITKASEAAQTVVGINKAITIYSPSKYSGANTKRDIPMTFTPDNGANIALNTDYTVKSGLEPVGHRDITEKVECYSVRPVQRHYGTIPEGLGPLSTEIGSVNELLLFNEPQLVYGDGLGGRYTFGQSRGHRALSQVPPTLAHKLDAAPLSISNRRLGNRKTNDSLSYMPGMTEAPHIDVPDDLPDLPGIADDISFDISGIDDLPIVPTVNSNWNLPEVTPDLSTAETLAQTTIDGGAQLMQVVEPQQMLKQHTQTKMPTTVVAQDTERILSERKVVAIPPPPPPPIMNIPLPPPPPPLLHLSPLSNECSGTNTTPTVAPKATTKASEPKIESSDNKHSSLMAAIRQAGGLAKAKLRASSNKPDISVSATVVICFSIATNMYIQYSCLIFM